MAYLTHYSFNQLVNFIEFENLSRIEQDYFVNNIYNNKYLYYFFNQFELRKLLKTKILLEGKLELESFRYVNDRTDNKTFVFYRGGKVKYHLYKDCEALSQGFTDFIIPEDIQEEGDGAVDELRNWFKTNNFTRKRYENNEFSLDTLIMRYNAIFPKKYPNIEPIKSENSSMLVIDIPSSDIKEIEDQFDYDIFLDKIIELIKKRDYLCGNVDGNYNKTMSNLTRYDYLLNKEDEVIKEIISKKFEGLFIENYGLKNLKQFWSKHIKLKNEAFSLLIKYFKWNYNFKDKQFDEIFLEDYNLQCCSTCLKRKNELKKQIL